MPTHHLLPVCEDNIFATFMLSFLEYRESYYSYDNLYAWIVNKRLLP